MLGTVFLFILMAGFVFLLCGSHKVRFEDGCNIFQDFIIARFDGLSWALRKLLGVGNNLTRGYKHRLLGVIAVSENDFHVMLDRLILKITRNTV